MYKIRITAALDRLAELIEEFPDEPHRGKLGKRFCPYSAAILYRFFADDAEDINREYPFSWDSSYPDGIVPDPNMAWLDELDKQVMSLPKISPQTDKGKFVGSPPLGSLPLAWCLRVYASKELRDHLDRIGEKFSLVVDLLDDWQKVELEKQILLPSPVPVLPFGAELPPGVRGEGWDVTWLKLCIGCSTRMVDRVALGENQIRSVRYTATPTKVTDETATWGVAVSDLPDASKQGLGYLRNLIEAEPAEPVKTPTRDGKKKTPSEDIEKTVAKWIFKLHNKGWKIEKHKKITLQILSDRTELSTSTIGRTKAWTKYQDEWKKRWPPKRSAKPILDDIPDERERELKRLVADQEADDRTDGSPLESRPKKRQIPVRKRV